MAIFPLKNWDSEKSLSTCLQCSDATFMLHMGYTLKSVNIRHV